MFPEKQPLPANTYDTSRQDTFHSAYQYCLAMETAAIGNNEGDLIHARCLGYLIRELPVQENSVVVNEVISCNSDFGKMRDLSRIYIDHLFRLFWRPERRTPVSTDSPTPTTLRRAVLSEAVDPSPANHVAAKISALKRDNYRCVVTGYADFDTYRSLSPDEQLRVFKFAPNGPRIIWNTNYCAIFPFLLDWNIGHDDKERSSGGVWSILKDFGCADVVNGDKTYNLRNGLTMIEGLRRDFYKLNLWFEEIPDHLNSYHVRTYLGDYHALLRNFPPNHIITFTTTDAQRLPLPDPRYLRLHAAVCRVAHLSGVASYLTSQDLEFETLGGLARDGSSATLLASRLTMLSA